MDLRVLTDEILLQLLKANNELAFKEIYTRYWQRLFETAYHRLASRETAKELVQTVFLRIWEKRHSNHITHLQSYLQTAIKNSVINYVAATLVHKRYLQHIINTGSTTYQGAESTLTIHELSQAIDKAVAALPAKTRQVFRLSRFDHLSIREIATILNISEKAVEYHITQSLKTLRSYLKDYLDIAL
ncbi:MULTISPECIES: RNA polymerase sigma factor [Niastella]|uniref:RNA polymerase sigma-70 factor n=1 Tax=Niastella soli TaxID=2821487 RepID=A0ABS3Z687_9BACT|nr:RNA polymerase sigma-70 factor [Niastella soli]MBO9205302.1 RNA polymerase sigma-70 factor [Niastella soli]